MTIDYVNPDAEAPPRPTYPGTFDERLVPATLDLEHRARLAVNALTETLDPRFDDELYWIVDLLGDEPTMYHSGDDHVQDKFFQALPLVRTICGSDQNLDVEARLMHTYLRKQGADGLVYIPLKGRPWALPDKPNPWTGMDELPTSGQWCSIIMLGRVLGAFAVYALKDPAGPWRDAGQRLVDGITRIMIVDGDIAYPYARSIEPDRPVVRPNNPPAGWRAAIGGWLAQGLAQWGRFLDDPDAAELSRKMMRYIFRDSGYFGPDGEFRREFPEENDWQVHFHAHTCQIMSALEVVQATGDRELLDYALRAYEYALAHSEPRLGFFPEWLNYRGGNHGPNSSETCEVADMVAAAVKLSLLGVDRWDDVDRWVRNQFVENQLTTVSWMTDGHLRRRKNTMNPWSGDSGALKEEQDGDLWATTDRVPERVIGSFMGWPSANDLVQRDGWSIMHCCTGNGARSIYYAWEGILTRRADVVQVNLLLNRRSEVLDIASHVPYEGLVEMWPKATTTLRVRVPEWVDPVDVTCIVSSQSRALTVDGRYVEVGSVSAGDHVVVRFPMVERTDQVVVEKNRYTIIRRGNEVVAIDPPGQNHPLYQRSHYRTGETLWRKTRSFQPESEIRWA